MKYIQKTFDVICYSIVVFVLIIGLNDFVLNHKIPIPLIVWTQTELDSVANEFNKLQYQIMYIYRMCKSTAI